MRQFWIVVWLLWMSVSRVLRLILLLLLLSRYFVGFESWGDCSRWWDSLQGRRHMANAERSRARVYINEDVGVRHTLVLSKGRSPGQEARGEPSETDGLLLLNIQLGGEIWLAANRSVYPMSCECIFVWCWYIVAKCLNYFLEVRVNAEENCCLLNVSHIRPQKGDSSELVIGLRKFSVYSLLVI